jgi:hypothetical protein
MATEVITETRGTSGLSGAGHDIPAQPVLRGVPLGAVFGGVFTAFAVQVLLTLLGAAIGLSVISPGNTPSAEAFRTGAGLWALLSVLVSLFLGGYVAARLAGVATSGDGAVAGFVQWATAITLLFFVGVSGIQSLLGTTLRAAGTGAAAAATGAGAAAADPSARDAMAAGANRLNRIANEQLDEALRNAGIPAIPAEPRNQMIERLYAGDKAGAADILAANSNLNHSDAVARIDAAERQIRDYGHRVADSAATGAWYSLGILVLALGASLLGGVLGVPNPLVFRRNFPVDRPAATTTVTGDNTPTTPTVRPAL